MTRPLPYHERRNRITRIICVGCGEPRFVERPNAKWCGDACRMRVARDQASDRVRCAICGVRRAPDAFATRNGAVIGPCRSCRSALARQRRIERARALIVCDACKVARRPADFSARSRRCRLCKTALAHLRRSTRTLP